MPQQVVMQQQIPQQVPHSYQQGQMQYQQVPVHVPQYQQFQPGSNVLHDQSRIQDKQHLKVSFDSIQI